MRQRQKDEFLFLMTPSFCFWPFLRPKCCCCLWLHWNIFRFFQKRVPLFALLPGGLNSCKQRILEKEITPGSEWVDGVVGIPRFTTALKYPFLHLTDGHLVPNWTLLWQILTMARQERLYCYIAVFSGLIFLTFIQDYYPTFMPIPYDSDLYNFVLLLFKNQDSSG